MCEREDGEEKTEGESECFHRGVCPFVFGRYDVEKKKVEKSLVELTQSYLNHWTLSCFLSLDDGFAFKGLG